MKTNSRSPRHYEKLKSDSWQTWERMWVQLVSCIGVYIHHLTFFHEYVPTKFFLSSQHSGPVAPHSTIWSGSASITPSSCTDIKYQWQLSICILPFPDPHDCWASVRCPWYHPHLSSLCTSCFKNFLSSGDSQNVISSDHSTLPTFFICRYFPPHCLVLFSLCFTLPPPQSLLLPANRW